jgi:hypothetical protein
MSGESVHTIYGQHDEKDAADVARREAEASHLRVLSTVRTYRGVIPGTWVVVLAVVKQEKP